jgi:fructosamine-3-kinase
VIAESAAAAIGAPLVSARRVAGGDINDAWLLELAGGRRAFVKSRAGAPAGEYATEAAGLRWLGAVEGGVRVPEVLAVGDVNACRRARRTAGIEEAPGPPVNAARARVRAPDAALTA